jgi:hypothetical protein
MILQDQTIDRSYCGTLDYNYPIYSNTTFKAAFGTMVSQTIITSLQVRDANNKIFALAGTSQGQLLKVVILCCMCSTYE